MPGPNTRAIFFDIETSDLSPVGQILNFCFTLTDEHFEPIEECSGDIKLSRLQLPRAGAILANRIRIEDHQRSAQYNEYGAMKEIHAFITKAAQGGQTSLIGYNSARFDLEYLRTSMIRNGFNPYFKVANKDLLFASRKLSVSDPAFPRIEHPAGSGRLSLSLECLSQGFGLLKGNQAHESRDDVRLTIELAKYYWKHFGLDVRTYMPYEAMPYMNKGEHPVLLRHEPQYDIANPKRSAATPYVLLDSNYKYALWINLNRFLEIEQSGQELRAAIQFFKFEGSNFFTDGEDLSGSELQPPASRSLKALSKITLANYFKETDCDIEAHIYRVDLSLMECLRQLLSGAPAGHAPADVRRLSTRWKLANAKEENERLWSLLKEYALYRYGGRMKINRFSTASYEEGLYSPDFHPTFEELRKEVREALGSASEDANACMMQLLAFYERSPIYMAAGPELEAISRRREEADVEA